MMSLLSNSLHSLTQNTKQHFCSDPDNKQLLYSIAVRNRITKCQTRTSLRQFFCHYYTQQADVQDDVTFGGYEMTSKNPGPALIYYFTIIVCLILFLIGMLFIPSSPVYPYLSP